MIEIRGLKKAFAATPVLRGVDLHVDDGEVLALIGRSGCGKTTLLRCINFLEDYDEGEIRLDGHPLWYRTDPDGRRRRVPDQEARRMRQQMGVVFQQYNLFPHMTALENVCLGPRFSQKVPAAEFMAKLKKLQPRLYSISSSPKAHPGQVHLTVAVVRQPRNGVCSTFLAERAETVPVCSEQCRRRLESA